MEAGEIEFRNFLTIIGTFSLQLVHSIISNLVLFRFYHDEV
jgi:hypothetical protein